MQEPENTPEFARDLRIRAERQASTAGLRTDDLMTPRKTRQVLHELRVHQIELEMQNDELRRVQAELEAARARYFDLYDLAPVGYCTLNDSNLVIEANLTLGTMLGRKREVLVGYPFTRFVYAEDQDRFYLYRRNVVPGQHLCELRLVKENGDHFWAQLESVIITDKRGTPILSIALSDITQRKLMEAKLDETGRELVERIVQLQKQVITDTKSDLNHETDSRILAEIELSHRQKALEAVYAMETAASFTMETLYDQIVSSIAATLNLPLVSISEYWGGKFIHGSNCLDNVISRRTIRENPCQACKTVLDAGSPRQFSGDLGVQFDGPLCFDSGRFHAYAGVPVKGPDGEVFGLITILDDIERHFAQYEIKFIEIFARYVSHELSRRDLESQIQRNNELQLLGKLTSGVAHEVRNPLNGILAVMSALAKEFEDEGRFQPYMDHMNTQVTRLTVLMEDLLTLGRPIHRENMRIVSMGAVFSSVLATWLDTLQTSKPVVRLIEPETPHSCLIQADDAAMTQMIINLLENAHNHSPAGAEIVCSITDRDDEHVVFTVKDSGAGIPENILGRIFDPFFTTRKGGTGLGLSIVRTLIENHYGAITANNNTDGPGATFTVTLPKCAERRTRPR